MAGVGAARLVLGFGAEVGAGDTLEALIAAVSGPLSGLSHGAGPQAVGLRLSGRALEALADPERRAAFAEALTAAGLALVALDGTAPGPLSETRTKEHAYLPDWRDEDRLHYTVALAGLLAEAAPPGHALTISTIPGAYGPLVGGTGSEAEIADGLLRAAAHALAIARETGRRVAIALQPAPFGLIETAEAAARFFAAWLFAPAGLRRFAALADLARGEAPAALRRHLGLAFDTAHAAVMGEDVATAMRALEAEAVPVHRLRLSAAAVIAPVTAAGNDALAPARRAPLLSPVVGADAAGAPLRFPDLDGVCLPEGGAFRVLWRQPLAAVEDGPVASTRETAEAALRAVGALATPPQIELVGTGPAAPPSGGLAEVAARARADAAWASARL